MKLIRTGKLVRRVLHDICPVLYVGQIVRLLLELDPRMREKQKLSKDEYEQWVRRRRTAILRTLKELEELEELGSFIKVKGYFHEPIATPGPLLRIPPGGAVENRAAAEEEIKAALKQAWGGDNELVGYYVPTRVGRRALKNPYYREVVEWAESHPIDTRGQITIDSFRLGSVYVSQVVFNRSEAKSFKLEPRIFRDGDILAPQATIQRAHGETVLYAADSELARRLRDLSEKQERSDRWLELWL